MKSKNGNTGEVYEIYSSLCKHTEQEPLTQRRITQIIGELDQLGLVATDVISQGRYRQITENQNYSSTFDY